MSETIVEKISTVVTQNTSVQTIVTGLMGPTGITTISNASDLDKTQLADGAVLVYKADTATWLATNLLNNQIIEAGQF